MKDMDRDEYVLIDNQNSLIQLGMEFVKFWITVPSAIPTTVNH